ncbi:glycerophosphoryl diester phosphodiesterase [Fulvitalea axinellae]|uniref:Glycerophosphoryl diester phosphodiesterase n=1 Tax=Fulvitalea axinellae TaxID=1182444 RepID=A0AAU9C8V8_9BACT|nr:glycerophosphoryl diester phosphodiesterase [Fulvitalea axinellae]
MRNITRLWAFVACVCLMWSCVGKQESTHKGSYLKLKTVKDNHALFGWTYERIPMISAHRGGPAEGYPENSLEAFRRVASQMPVIIECDVALTSDDSLMLMHDNTVNRTTNGMGNINDLTYAQVKDLLLEDDQGAITDYRVPSFSEALRWVKGKAVYTVDVKKGVPWKSVIDAIHAQGAAPYCAVITYNADDAYRVHALDPEMMISVTIRNEEEYKRHRDAGVPDNRMIAFTGLTERPKEFYQMLHDKGIMCIIGAIGNLDKKAVAKGEGVYLDLVNGGADIIATDRPVEAYKAIQIKIDKESPIYRKYFR